MTFEKDLIGRYAYAKGWRRPPKSGCFVAADDSSRQWTGACNSNDLNIVASDQYAASIRLDCRLAGRVQEKRYSNASICGKIEKFVNNREPESAIKFHRSSVLYAILGEVAFMLCHNPRDWGTFE
jgi:hypothetical protein